MDPDGDLPQDDSDAAPRRGSGSARTIGVGIAVVAVLVAVVALLLGGGSQEEAGPDLAVLDPSATADGLALTNAVDTLPDFTLGQFGGEGQVQVSQFLGDKPLVINFWATWCPPCVAEMPDFQRIHEAAGNSFRLVGINTQDAEVNAEPFVADLGITYELAVDRMGEYFRATGGFGMPTTLFVQPDGTVSYRQTGPLTVQQMVDLLAEHLDVRISVEDA
ncbi:MAG: TlpA family protein disulfide reductase [Euzebya sp.]